MLTKRNYSPVYAKYMPHSLNIPMYRLAGLIDYLKATGQYENTIIMYAADNGASGEGTPKRFGK